MKKSLYTYFLKSIFKAENRQRLIIISIVSLILSSMALTVIQSIMGGLQHGLISRSKEISGEGIITVSDQSSLKEHLKFLSNYSEVAKEFELELLLKNGSYVHPAIVRGIDTQGFVPAFLKEKNLSGILLGGDLAYKLKSYFEDDIKMISPAHVDLFFEEIPRSATESVSDFVNTDLIEVDGVTAWVRMSFLQNMAREKTINQLRLYHTKDLTKIVDYINQKSELNWISWEEQNRSLVWALSLESNVMLFLFTSLVFLVSITITTGFVIFFDKLKVDLTSLWILGTPKKELRLLGFRFSRHLSFFSCLLGVVIGGLLLFILDTYPIKFMPDIFVQQNLPVRFKFRFFLIAFSVPFGVSYLLTWYSQKVFLKQEVSYLDLIKKSF